MEELDPDKLKGPGGLTLRQIHQQVKLEYRSRRRRSDTEQLRPNSGVVAAICALHPQYKGKVMRAVLMNAAGGPEVLRGRRHRHPGLD